MARSRQNLKRYQRARQAGIRSHYRRGPDGQGGYFSTTARASQLRSSPIHDVQTDDNHAGSNQDNKSDQQTGASQQATQGTSSTEVVTNKKEKNKPTARKVSNPKAKDPIDRAFVNPKLRAALKGQKIRRKPKNGLQLRIGSRDHTLFSE